MALSSTLVLVKFEILQLKHLSINIHYKGMSLKHEISY